MARIRKVGTGIEKDMAEYIVENRNNLSTIVMYGGVDVFLNEDNILCGGHFKLRSAMRQAGLSVKECDKALE